MCIEMKWQNCELSCFELDSEKTSKQTQKLLISEFEILFD